MSRKRKENTRGFGAQGTNTQGVSTQGFSRLKQREAMMRIYQMAGLDGFTNPAAFLGEASPLMASGTFVRSGLTGNIDLLTRVYRENWLARRIIDTPAEDMTRAWYSLATGKSKEDLDELARLEAPEDMRILFEPVKTMGATEQVKLAAEHTRMVLEAFEKGIISKGEALDELKGMSGKTNIWVKLEGGEMHGEGQQDGRDSGRVFEDLSAGGMEDSGFDFGSRDAAGGGGAADRDSARPGFRKG